MAIKLDKQRKKSIWTASDTKKQIKYSFPISNPLRQHKKSFIEYIGDIWTKKEDTIVSNSEFDVPKQRYFLTKKERNTVSNRLTL